MKQNIGVYPQGDTVTILEGRALDPRHPEKIKLAGNILAVAAFLSARYSNGRTGYSQQQVDKEKAVVVVDSSKMTIDLSLNPENDLGTEVHAQLEFTDEFLQWGINQNKTFSREQIIKLFRFNRRFFSDLVKYDALLLAYQKLSISTSGELNQSSDTRGNRGIDFQKRVNSENIPTEFILEVPIFKGYDVEKFRVEICLDATDASVAFWFESVELVEIIEQRKTEIFDAQLEHCQDFVIIQK